LEPLALCRSRLPLATGYPSAAVGQKAPAAVCGGEGRALLGISRIADKREAQRTLGRRSPQAREWKGGDDPLAAIGRTRERI
jgi:hypothetical protein